MQDKDQDKGPSFTERVLVLDAAVKKHSVTFWEWLLGITLLPKRQKSDIDFLSEADRIEEEPINQNYSVTLYVILILIVAGSLWAALSPLDQVVSAQGKVISVEPNIILQPQETAEIKEVKIGLGQSVRKGDVLFILDPTIPQADYAQAQGSYQGVMRALEISLNEIRNIEARIAAAKETEEMTKQLVEKNFQSRRALIEQTEKRLELQQAHLNAKARQSDLISQRNALEQQLVKAKRRQDLIQIVAPRDGVILEVSTLTRGSVARATEPLVTLVPTDVPIMAEVLIDPASISGVTTGQRVKIKLDSFPFQRYGYIEGTVAALSPDAVQSRSGNGGSAYVARVEFDRTDETAGLLAQVIPGMTLSAEVITDKRTVLAYIFDPLLKIKMESLNEK